MHDDNKKLSLTASRTTYLRFNDIITGELFRHLFRQPLSATFFSTILTIFYYFE